LKDRRSSAESTHNGEPGLGESLTDTYSHQSELAGTFKRAQSAKMGYYDQQAATIASIREILGEPAVGGDQFLIYQGDCQTYLSQLPSDSLPLVVTSPPYNIGKEYETTRPLQDYLDWCEQWIAEMYRLATPDGAFWLNLGYIGIERRAKAIPIPYLLWDRIPFYLIQEVVWNYGAGVAGKTFFSPRNEKFLWYVKNAANYTFNLDHVRDPNVAYPNQKKNGKLKCNPLGKNPTDVWQFPKVTSGTNRSSRERTSHPAQFPLGVIERIVKVSSNPGDLILDPFMGSGSLIEAALGAGRAAVGFEINPGYVEIAAARIQKAIARKAETQGTLF